MKGADKLSHAADRLKLISRENPCHWSDAVLGTIADGLNLMLGEKTRNGVTLMELADYYHVTIRTIERWRKECDDFPKPIDPYAKTLAFPTDEVIEWKQKHTERF